MNWKRATLAALLVLLVVPFAFAQDASDASMDQAKRLYRNGDFRSALTELNRIVATRPSAEALYLIGYSHVMLREYDEAVNAFSQAFETNPSFDPRTIYQRPRPEPEPEPSQ